MVTVNTLTASPLYALFESKRLPIKMVQPSNILTLEIILTSKLLLLAHKTPVLPMLVHPPSMIHLMLQEWCAHLVPVAQVHRNALPVDENLPTSVATVDFRNVSHRLSAQCSRA